MKYTYRVFRDNAGFLHLAVLSGEECVYYLVDEGNDLVPDALTALENGGDPIAEGWEGGEINPSACYCGIIILVNARNGSASEIEASEVIKLG